MGIADELRCAWGLDIFADQIDAIAERVEDREELDARMQVADERIRKSPCGISVQYTLKSMRRDRRYQEDMRNIVKAGGRFYRGKEIKGGDDLYIIRFTRKELMAEFRHDLPNMLGVGAFPDYQTPMDAIGTTATPAALTPDRDEEIFDKIGDTPVVSAPVVDEMEGALIAEAESGYDEEQDAADAEADAATALLTSGLGIEPSGAGAADARAAARDAANANDEKADDFIAEAENVFDTAPPPIEIRMSASERYVWSVAHDSIPEDLDGVDYDECTGQEIDGLLICDVATEGQRAWVRVHIVAIWDIQHDCVTDPDYVLTEANEKVKGKVKRMTRQAAATKCGHRKRAASKLSQRLYAALKEVDPNMHPFDFGMGCFVEKSTTQPGEVTRVKGE
jgi:hypothetical protein